MLLLGFSCKRMNNSTSTGEDKPAAPVSKSSAIKGIPEAVDQKPIDPSHARVVLTILKIMPELQEDGTGPCSLAPCKAEAQVRQVLGYGSGVPQVLANGQKLQVHFPM